MKRTHIDGETLTEDEVNLIYSSQRCPDCRRGLLLEGPSGGGSQNYFCDDTDCGSRFNNCLDWWDRISDASPKKRNKCVTKGPYR